MSDHGMALDMATWNRWHDRSVLEYPSDHVAVVGTTLILAPDEVERYEEIRETKRAAPVQYEFNAGDARPSIAVHRCRGNGSRQRTNMIGRNY